MALTIRYDDEILRHSFYANLLEPYLLQGNRENTRLDVLIAARAVAACTPDAVNIPRSADGKPVFKLEGLARANGFVGHDAHDALGDVHATMHIAKVIMENAPSVWSTVSNLRSKQYVAGLLQAGEPLINVGWDYQGQRPLFRAVLPIVCDAENSNEWLCVGLDVDIGRLKSLDADSLEGQFNSDDGRPAIVRLKANAMPLLMTTKDAAALNVSMKFDPFTIIALKADSALAGRLRAASNQHRSRLLQPTQVWEQIYSGGFFPTYKDKPVIQRFHRALPHEKWEMVPALTDQRAREMARWLIGSEWPEVLSPAERRLIEDEFRDHLMQDDAKWTTVPSALARIKELCSGANVKEAAILYEYEGFLLNYHKNILGRSATS